MFPYFDNFLPLFWLMLMSNVEPEIWNTISLFLGIIICHVYGSGLENWLNPECLVAHWKLGYNMKNKGLHVPKSYYEDNVTNFKKIKMYVRLRKIHHIWIAKLNTDEFNEIIRHIKSNKLLRHKKKIFNVARGFYKFKTHAQRLENRNKR